MEEAAPTAADGLVVAGPKEIASALRRLAGSGALGGPVRALPVPDDGSVPPSEASNATVLWFGRFRPLWWLTKVVPQLPALEWVHSDYAGVDTFPLSDLADRGITLTNGLGNFSRPMAEWIVLSMLSAVKRLPHLVRCSDAGIWDTSHMLGELDGTVALFLGLGSTGELAARMAAPFGVEVRAAVRRPREQLPEGVSRLVLGEAWRDELAEADFVVCALPLTAATAGMLDAAAFTAMKPTAWVVNVARGALIDETALIEALDAGRIGGAVLDAFEEEPLPAGHPLWGRPNVVVVPHHTWSSMKVVERIDALFASQLRRWMAGEPLANTVDLAAGY